MFQINDRVRIKRDAQLGGHEYATRVSAFRDARTTGVIDAAELNFGNTPMETAFRVNFSPIDSIWFKAEFLEPAELDHTRAAVGKAKLVEALEQWKAERPSRAEREVTLADKVEALKQEFDRLIDEWGEHDWTSKEADALDDQLDIVRSAIVDLLPQVIKALRFSTENKVREAIQQQIAVTETVIDRARALGWDDTAIYNIRHIGGLRAALQILDEVTDAKH